MGEELPDDILMCIFSYIEFYEEQYAAISMVNRKWKEIIKIFAEGCPRSITIGFVGVMSSGKSSCLGRMLSDMGYLNMKSSNLETSDSTTESTTESTTDATTPVGTDHKEIELYKMYGALLDNLKEERTLFKHTRNFKRKCYGSCPLDKSRYVCLMDLPSYERLPNIVLRGITLCNAIVIFLKIDQFTSREHHKNIKKLLNRYILSAYTQGINQAERIIICINRMELVNYSKGEYEKACDLIRKSISIGINASNVAIIPISVLQNVNIVSNKNPFYEKNAMYMDLDDSLGDFIHETESKDVKMPWYDGPSLSDAIMKLDSTYRYTIPLMKTKSNDVPAKRVVSDPLIQLKDLQDKPLRFIVHRIFILNMKGHIATGLVASGTLKVNSKILINPHCIDAKVKSIHINHVSFDEALPGDYISINLGNDIPLGSVYRGCIITSKSDPVLKPVQSFVAKVVVLSGVKALRASQVPLIMTNSQHCSCLIDHIIAQVKKNSDKVLQDSPPQLAPKEHGFIGFSVRDKSTFLIEPYESSPYLGRFIGQFPKIGVVMVGIVHSVKYVTELPTLIQKKKKKSMKIIREVKETRRKAPKLNENLIQFAKKIPESLSEEIRNLWDEMKFMSDQWEDVNVDSISFTKARKIQRQRKRQQ